MSKGRGSTIARDPSGSPLELLAAGCYRPAMQFDIEDVLAGVFGRIFLLVLFMLNAAWIGSIIGGLAWFVGN